MSTIQFTIPTITMYESVVNKRKGKNVIIILFFVLNSESDRSYVSSWCWLKRYLLFIADDVAIISVPTPNLVLHGNDITYIGKALIIVGTIYSV